MTERKDSDLPIYLTEIQTSLCMTEQPDSDLSICLTEHSSSELHAEDNVSIVYSLQNRKV
jgi:hypothetical protein